MSTIFEYCQNHILIIPEAFSMASEAVPVAQSGNSSIFYKALTHDLPNVEFYTKMPCLVYIEEGYETITNRSGETFALQPTAALLLPRGISLRSDYVSASGTLKSYLAFFSGDSVEEFLTRKAIRPTHLNAQTKERDPWLVGEQSEPISQFFRSVQVLHEAGMNQPGIARIKFLELLMILDQVDSRLLSQVLATYDEDTQPRRNLNQLMANPRILRLTITDLAHLSGRSLSTFNRDFRAVFGISPKKWQIERRLTVAHSLLVESDISVTDIAHRVGYQNTSHFISTYKNHHGCTPSQARKQNN